MDRYRFHRKTIALAVVSITASFFLIHCAFIKKSPTHKLVYKSINFPDGSRLELYQDITPESDLLFSLQILLVYVARDGTATAIWSRGIADGRLSVLDTMEITGDSIPEVVSLWEDEGGYWGAVHHLTMIDSFHVKLQTMPIPDAGWPWEMEVDTLTPDSSGVAGFALSRRLFRTVGDSSIVFKGGFYDCDSIVILFDRTADSLRAVCMGKSGN